MIRRFFPIFTFALFLVSAAGSEAQTLGLDVLSFDATGYPTITAKVRATADGFAIRNLADKNFAVRENGVPMITLVTSCEDSASAGPVSALLIIDKSGSMRNTIAAAKAAANNFVDRLSPADEMALISFYTVPSVDQNWTQNKAAMKAQINAITVPLFGGSTSLWDAIDRGITLLRTAKHRKAMIVLTDGKDNSSAISFNDVRYYAMRDSIAVYTIGLGTDIDEPALTDISRATGGKYFFTPDTTDLDRIYSEITERITTTGICTLTYQSPLDCLDGTAVSVDYDLTAYGKTFTKNVSYNRPVDSTTMSFVSLAIDRKYVVDAGGEITIPLDLTRVTPNRAPDRFNFTVLFDTNLLELVAADTSALSKGYAMTTTPTTGGSMIRMTGPTAILTTGTLLRLTFKARDLFESHKVEIGVSRPDVGQVCTYPHTDAGQITISGRCERATIKTSVATKPVVHLLPPSPNPFNPDTHVRFDISTEADVRMLVYDASGRVVRTLVDGKVPAGTHDILFDGAELPTGPYYLVMHTLGETRSQRLMLVK